MADRPTPPRFIRSPMRDPPALKSSSAWGALVRYIEFADDGFAIRQVDVYANGNAVAYDREHWEDRFGVLADFRFGQNWQRHWGEPTEISPQEFLAQWNRAESLRATLDAPRVAQGSPLWIALFESGKWKGQS